MVGVQGACHAAHRAGDDEGGQAIGIGRQADGPAARRVGLRGAQHHAEAGIDDPVSQEHEQQHHAERDVVEGHRVAQVDQPGELALALESHAVIAAVDVERDAKVVEHLGESERDHDEVDAAGAHRHRADGRGDQSAGADRHQQVDPAVGDAVEAEDAHGIGANAEIGGMAEGHQPAVAEDQVQADGGDGEDQDAPRQVDVVRLAERGHERRQGHEEHRRDAPEDQPRSHRFANKPAGLTARTTAISR